MPRTVFEKRTRTDDASDWSTGLVVCPLRHRRTLRRNMRATRSCDISVTSFAALTTTTYPVSACARADRGDAKRTSDSATTTKPRLKRHLRESRRKRSTRAVGDGASPPPLAGGGRRRRIVARSRLGLDLRRHRDLVGGEHLVRV